MSDNDDREEVLGRLIKLYNCEGGATITMPGAIPSDEDPVLLLNRCPFGFQVAHALYCSVCMKYSPDQCLGKDREFYEFVRKIQKQMRDSGKPPEETGAEFE